MEKVISTLALRRSFGNVLRGVLSRGEQFVVERNVQPVAAVVPIQVYEQWKKGHRLFFEKLRQAAD